MEKQGTEGRAFWGRFLALISDFSSWRHICLGTQLFKPLFRQPTLCIQLFPSARNLIINLDVTFISFSSFGRQQTFVGLLIPANFSTFYMNLPWTRLMIAQYF